MRRAASVIGLLSIIVFAATAVVAGEGVAPPAGSTSQPSTQSAWPFDLTILRPAVTVPARDRLRFIVEARGSGDYRDPPFDDAEWTSEDQLPSYLHAKAEAAIKGNGARLVVIVYGKPVAMRSGPDRIDKVRLNQGRTMLILCNPTYHFGSARVLFVVNGRIVAERAVPLE